MSPTAPPFSQTMYSPLPIHVPLLLPGLTYLLHFLSQTPTLHAPLQNLPSPSSHGPFRSAPITNLSPFSILPIKPSHSSQNSSFSSFPSLAYGTYVLTTFIKIPFQHNFTIINLL